jgi:ornithine cyclodeaminase/alanine dehydrogenase-like protein (mu-crystallin family)
VAAGILTPDSPITELGELTSGKMTGRQNDHEITICDLVGVGVQDTSIALLAYQRVVERGLGIEIEN